MQLPLCFKGLNKLLELELKDGFEFKLLLEKFIT